MSYSASSYPYDTVVQITDTIGSQSWQGSGVLISPDEVLTASYVVYTQGIGVASDIVVTPAYNDGASPYGAADGAYVHYFPVDDANRTITNQQSQFDYAVIHLATPFTSAGFMGLEANFAGGPVDITGYPASANGAQVTSSQTVAVDPNYTLLDGTALGEGSSGGPVWISTASGPDVVGTVSSGSDTTGAGYNALITTAAFNQIESWVKQDDAGLATPAPASPATVVGAGPHSIATFSGPRPEYTIDYTGNGQAIVTDNALSGPSAVTSINNEVLQFSDQPYFIESSDGSNIARLYSAGLNRIPDARGLFGWEDLYGNNVSASAKAQGVYVSLAETSGGFNGTLSIADGIIDSPEFSAKYGALTSADFVTQLYQNVLGRAPDAAGLQGWLTWMSTGDATGTVYSRGMVLVGFAESSENIAKASSWMTDMSAANRHVS